MKQQTTIPSMDAWIQEAKAAPNADKVGMYLFHNGVVRGTAKAQVRLGQQDTAPVTGMVFSYDQEKVDAAVEAAYQLEGVYYIKVWLNQGALQVGDDIMYVLVGGDIRPHVVDGLQFLVERLKTQCVTEAELH